MLIQPMLKMRCKKISVFYFKYGVYFICHSREGGNPFRMYEGRAGYPTFCMGSATTEILFSIAGKLVLINIS